MGRLAVRARRCRFAWAGGVRERLWRWFIVVSLSAKVACEGSTARAGGSLGLLFGRDWKWMNCWKDFKRKASLKFNLCSERGRERERGDAYAITIVEDRILGHHENILSIENARS